MDTGDYDTNTLLISHVSSVAYRFYEPSPELSPTFASIALDIENSLRDEGHIVSYDATRRGIWHFRFLSREENSDAESHGSQPPLEVASHGLVQVEDGMIEPPTLQKARSQAYQSNNTPTSSSSTGSTLDQAQRHTLIPPSQSSAPSSQDYESKGAHSLGIESKSGPSLQKILYENLITSFLLTVSAAFCQQANAIPLNYRTVLFPLDSSDVLESQDAAGAKCPVLGSFRAYLTTTGALVVSLTLSHCKGLLSLEDAINSTLSISGNRILAAPFGVMTNNQLSVSGEGGTASLAQTPITQAVSLRGAPDNHDSLWKQACLRFLHFRGIASSTLGGCHWVNLLVAKHKSADHKPDHRLAGLGSTHTLPWPDRLCFRKRSVDVSSTSRVFDSILSGHEESHDPLGNAKGWFNTSTERDEKVSRRLAERSAAAHKDANGGDLRTSKPNGQSPSALRRPSTTAAGVMYPTPPDGVQHNNGVTPSIDGTLSSPGNPLSALAPEADANHPNEPSTGDNLAQSPDFSEPKRPRSESNLLGDTDNMFEDMGGDMFDDNDITEADFNFFDEQPDDIDLDISMGDLAASEPVEHPPPKVAEDIVTPLQEAVPQPPPEPEAVVFAKPELKHARSCQPEETIQRTREARGGPAKRDSSPFDPHTVFKRVRASLSMAGHGRSTISQTPGRKAKIFDSVDFDPRLPMINKKYEQGGLFSFDFDSKSETMRPELPTLPETDYLKRHGKLSKMLNDRPGPISSLLKNLAGTEVPLPSTSGTKGDRSVSDVEESSLESDQDDSSQTTEEPSSPQRASVKHTNIEDDVVSQVTSLRGTEVMEEPDHQLAVELPRLSKPDVSEILLPSFFSDPEPSMLDTSLSDDDLIQIAQILTDQAATGALDIGNVYDYESTSRLASQSRPSLSAHTRSAFHILEGVISKFLGDSVAMRLKGLLDVQDVPLLGQPTRLQPRPIPGREPTSEPVRPSNLYQIPSPHLEVRRADAKLSVLPSAVSFWESLGLAPSSGNKNIHAVCVFPGWVGMGDNVKTFLGRVKSVYEFLKLGAFDNITLPQEMENGLLPYEVDRISTSPDATVTGHGSALIESMEILRGAFANLALSEANLVVYFVYSSGNPGSVIEACVAFQRLFESYQKMLATKREPAQNELVLQLVSAELLSSPTSMVVTSSPELFRLCIETYDRCTLFGGPMPAPAIRLEQPLPRIIDFKLTNTPSASLIRENSCIHVSYAQSVDERWVTAAWTDDRGNQQTTASYCLGRRGKLPSRHMNEIAHEIWETTLELISVWKIHWRVIITRCGPMPQHEMEFWVDLARTEITATVTMILMTVDTNPSLQLLPPAMRLPSSSTALYATPVSTPQGSILSPEQTTTPATPVRESNVTAATPAGEGASDADSDAILADVTDQTWGAVSGHRLSNSTSILEVQPTLISGYLIKRTGTRIEDAPVVMEVNLVHTEAMPRAYEPLLREMLSYFRGLGTLARARGVVDREDDVRPWHVAAAEKAVRALYLLM